MLHLRASALLLFGAPIFAACGNSVDLTPRSTGAGGAELPKPGPLKPGDGPGVVLAMTKLYLGDVDRDGTPNAANGWKEFGLDIDHKVSTQGSVDLRKPAVMAAPSDAYPEGNDGIDNARGRQILPIVIGSAPDTSEEVNAALASGAFTLVIHLVALGASSDYNPLVSKVYRGASLGKAPKFDVTDAWPVAAEDLTNPADIESAKLTFGQGYVTSGT